MHGNTTSNASKILARDLAAGSEPSSSTTRPPRVSQDTKSSKQDQECDENALLLQPHQTNYDERDCSSIMSAELESVSFSNEEPAKIPTDSFLELPVQDHRPPHRHHMRSITTCSAPIPDSVTAHGINLESASIEEILHHYPPPPLPPHLQLPTPPSIDHPNGLTDEEKCRTLPLPPAAALSFLPTRPSVSVRCSGCYQHPDNDSDHIHDHYHAYSPPNDSSYMMARMMTPPHNGHPQGIFDHPQNPQSRTMRHRTGPHNVSMAKYAAQWFGTMPYPPPYPMPWLWCTPLPYGQEMTVPDPSGWATAIPGALDYVQMERVDDVALLDEQTYTDDLEYVLRDLCCPLAIERKLHDDLHEAIQAILEKQFPGVTLKRFGSTENGFALRGADLDFCIITSAKAEAVLNLDDGIVRKFTASDPIYSDTASFITAFGERLGQEERFSAGLKILSRARVPIIKLKDNVTGLSCDIGVDNVLALYNTKLLKVYGDIQICKDQDQGICGVIQLALLVKLWAKQRELNDPYWGTLSSYCYLVMTIYYLQQKSLLPVLHIIPSGMAVDPSKITSTHVDGCTVRFICDPDYYNLQKNATAETTLLKLLEGFFSFYAHDFDYVNHVISIRTFSIVTKESKQWQLENSSIKGYFWLCIEDPFDLDQNLARTVNRNSLYHLRGQFIRAHRCISKLVPYARICSPYYP